MPVPYCPPPPEAMVADGVGAPDPQAAAADARGLRIGGLTPLTTLDFPGELAAVLYCQGCPWRCRYCHSSHLIPPNGGERISWESALAFLRDRRGLLDAVVLSGGEPTLQGALPAALAQIRALGFRVGLHTGGPWPERLAAVLGLVDWVGLDIKALPEDYPLVTGVPGSGERAWHSLALLLASGVACEVRTTPMPGLDDRAYLYRLMDRLAAAGVRHYALQQCRAGQLPDPDLRPRPLPADWPGQPFPQFVVRGLL